MTQHSTQDTQLNQKLHGHQPIDHGWNETWGGAIPNRVKEKTTDRQCLTHEARPHVSGTSAEPHPKVTHRRTYVLIQPK
jgi:hypothetical protein